MRYKYAVLYDLAIPWLDPMDFGASVHRCLEAIQRRAVQGQHVTPEDIPTLVEETWLSTPRTRPEQEKAYRQAAVHQLQRYLEQYGKCLLMTVNAETYFSTAHDRQVLLGKIDLIRRIEEQGMEIVDFKTSASDPREFEQTELQLSIYGLGVESQIEQPVVRISAHFLGDEQVKSWSLDAERIKDALARLDDLFGQVEHEEFPPRHSYFSRCHEHQRHGTHA